MSKLILTNFGTDATAKETSTSATCKTFGKTHSFTIQASKT